MPDDLTPAQLDWAQAFTGLQLARPPDGSPQDAARANTNTTKPAEDDRNSPGGSPPGRPVTQASPPPTTSRARFTIAVTDDGNKKYTVTGSGFVHDDIAQLNEVEIEVVPVDTVAFTGTHATATVDEKGTFSKQIEIDLLPRDTVKIYANSKAVTGGSNDVIVTARPDPNDTTPAERDPKIAATADKDRRVTVTGSGFTRVAEVTITISPIKSEVPGDIQATERVDAKGNFTHSSKDPFQPGGEWSIQAVSSHNGAIVSNKVVLKTPDDPNDPAFGAAQTVLKTYDDTYDAALQGASGRFADAREAAEFAQAVAEEAERSYRTHYKEFEAEFGDAADADLKEYQRFFNDSIQGLAAGKDSVGDVVKKSHLMAMAALRAQVNKLERLDWLAVTLPHPMAPDCKPVANKVRGPDNHKLCATHGHVVDTETMQVIAHTITEYDAMQSKGARQ